MATEIYVVRKHGDAWQLEMRGRVLGQYPTQGVALCAARRLARAASEHGQAAKVIARQLNKRLRREGVYRPLSARRAEPPAAAPIMHSGQPPVPAPPDAALGQRTQRSTDHHPEGSVSQRPLHVPENHVAHANALHSADAVPRDLASPP